MGYIYCLLGKSSTGKDTIYKKLLNSSELKLSKIVPYTTRPKRSNENNGDEYNFVSIAEKDKLLEEGNIIEMREYDTKYGKWYYFTVNDKSIDLSQKDYITIGTLQSFEKLKKYYGEDRVKDIYLEVDDATRLHRAYEREKSLVTPRFDEMCRRYLADCEDYAPEKIIDAGIKTSFRNDTTESVVKEIIEYVKKEDKIII